ncbi:hypothetical protein EZV62_007896 [Acer yangbiense]|uniref:Protein kinase domain-containing protein n=1 Tax=Acer yangbiense TaxID=1000413 RepID=A0A5C7IBW9_9ROSI|nr:hypothetical protein EZV62_007896 [Acer yangbiense]
MGNAPLIAFYITISCIAFVISKIIISVLLYRRWKRKHFLIYEDGFSGGKMVMFRSPLMQSLTSDALLKKTLKLSNKDIIGSGGFGTVYRLTINDSTAFAVKRLNRGTMERETSFERELETMGDIKHRNIVTLHGYYTAPHYNLLIYELMPNGSLDTFLHEYFDTGRATLKGDVYSFGVVLLELLTGKKPTDEEFLEEGTKLVTWVKAVVQDKREEYVLDARLEGCPINEISNVFSIALVCLESEPSKRPTMAEVVKMLEQIKSEKVVKDY